MFTLPRRARPNGDLRTTTLWFDPPKKVDRYGDRNGASGEFHMRGGIAWPVEVNPATGRVEGYAVLLGLNVRVGVFYVFEETPIITVDHATDRNGRVIAEGCAPWFNRCWERYYADMYYHGGPAQAYGRWAGLLGDSRLIARVPALVEVRVEARSAWPESLMLQLNQEGRLEIAGDSGLAAAIKAHVMAMEQNTSGMSAADRKPSAPVVALWAALVGCHEWPWLAPRAWAETESE